MSNQSIATRPARVWKLPANVDTDALAPGAYMKLSLDEIAPHCLETMRPEFAGGVRSGDIIVAGSNFGVGSSREQAAGALKALGIACVIAPSFAGLFYRNALNLGLTALVCADAEQIPDGSDFIIHREPAAISIATEHGSQCIPYEPLPPFLQEMVDAGGLLAQLRQRLSQPGKETN